MERDALINRARARGANGLSVSLEEGQKRLDLGNSLIGDPGDAVQIEAQPLLPVPMRSNVLQELIVPCTVPFEVEAHIEPRSLEHAFGNEQQGNEHAPKATVPIEEGCVLKSSTPRFMAAM
jgi:hypothetical protein